MTAKVTKADRTHNGILSQDTISTIIDTFLRMHGPASDKEIQALIQAATEAATALACFQMALRGELIAEVHHGAVAFRKAGQSSSRLEPTAGVLRRMVAEVSL